MRAAPPIRSPPPPPPAVSAGGGTACQRGKGGRCKAMLFAQRRGRGGDAGCGWAGRAPPGQERTRRGYEGRGRLGAARWGAAESWAGQGGDAMRCGAGRGDRARWTGEGRSGEGRIGSSGIGRGWAESRCEAGTRTAILCEGGFGRVGIAPPAPPACQRGKGWRYIMIYSIHTIPLQGDAETICTHYEEILPPPPAHSRWRTARPCPECAIARYERSLPQFSFFEVT